MAVPKLQKIGVGVARCSPSKLFSDTSERLQ